MGNEDIGSDGSDGSDASYELDASDKMFSDADGFFYVVMVLTFLYYKIILLYNIFFIFYCK